MGVTETALAAIADKVFETLERPREVVPFSVYDPGFDMSDAYRVVNDIRRRREARGERVVGRKIGFTNSAAWASYGISAPIWNYLYDRTTVDLKPGLSFPIGDFPNVRMETEVAFGLSRAPQPEMDLRQLLDCIEWTALDFEICTSIFPGWQFKVADAAATGVHVALLLGPRHRLGTARERWSEDLASFSVTLSEKTGRSAAGGGSQVLGSPLKAFSHLVRELARHGGEPLQAGDIVTTGTLTAALPATHGETWRAEAAGVPFKPIEIALR